MSESSRVELKIENQIAFVSLARPDKRNALDMEMFKAIADTIKKLRKNRDIQVVIVSGQGEDFCSGLDVKSIMKSKSAPLKLLKKWNPFSSNLAQFVSTGWQKIGVPVITVINGRCWGGGLHIALGADIRIATPNASLSIMEGRWGLIPDMGGLLALRTHCRLDVAKELTWTAKIIDGKQAKDFGLVTHLSETPKEAAMQLAEELIEQSPDTVSAVKKLYNKSWKGRKSWALFRESFYQIRILLGKNSRIKAYNQTHEPDEHKPFLRRKKW